MPRVSMCKKVWRIRSHWVSYSFLHMSWEVSAGIHWIGFLSCSLSSSLAKSRGPPGYFLYPSNVQEDREKGKTGWRVLKEARGLIRAYLGWQLSCISSQLLAVCQPAHLARPVPLARHQHQPRPSPP